MIGEWFRAIVEIGVGVVALLAMVVIGVAVGYTLIGWIF